MKYAISPEFHRQLWVDFSPFRLLAVPVMLGGLFVFWLLKKGEPSGTELVAAIVIWAYYLLLLFHGNFAASYAMPAEINTNTWDFQRVSAQTPAQLAFGKLFGATAYTWYCAGCLVLFYLFFLAPALGGFPFFTFLGVTVAGLLGHALAFLVSLFMASRHGPKLTGRRASSDMMLPFITGALAMVIGSLTGTSNSGFSFYNFSETLTLRTAEWHGVKYPAYAVALCSLLFLLGWALTGIYRTIRAELMYHTRPVVWAAFIPAFFIWYAGMFTRAGEGLYACATLMAQLCFLAMMSEHADIRKYRRFADGFKKGDQRRVFENMPKWVITLPFVLGAWLASSMYVIATGKAEKAAYLTALLLFMARDGFFIHWITLKRGYRSMFYILVYFICAYMLCPLVMYAFAGVPNPMGRVADGIGSLFFCPSYVRDDVTAMASGIFYPLGAAAKEAGGLVPAFLGAWLAGLLLLRAVKPAAGHIEVTKT